MPAAHRRRLGAMIAMALILTIAGILPASAERLELEQRVLFGEEGSTVELANEAIADKHVGELCTMTVITENQSSVHPDTDLIVTTGDQQAVIEDVESEANSGLELTAEVVLGDSIVVELRFGRHGLSSMGFEIDITCDDENSKVLAANATCDDLPDTDTKNDSDSCCESGNSGDSDGNKFGNECGPSSTTTTTIVEESTTTTVPEDPCAATDGGSLTADSDLCTSTTTAAPDTDGTTSTTSAADTGDTSSTTEAANQDQATTTTQDTTTTESTTTTTAAVAPANQDQSTTSTSEATTTTQASTTTTAAVAAANQGQTTTTTTGSSSDDEGTGAEVLGLTVEAIPQTAAAEAVPAQPSYTG